MNKFLRTVAKIFMLVTLTLLVTACGKEADNDYKIIDKVNHSRSLLYMSCTEEGLFYMANDQLLHYVTVSTGEDMIYCFDPICKHEPVSSDNPDSSCMAAGYVDKTRIAYHNSFVYFFVSDLFKHKIYKMDISSGVRELVTELPFDCEINCIVFEEDYVYYTAVIREEEEDGINLKRTYDMVEVNLKDGKYRMITKLGEKIGCNNFLFDVFEQTLFVRTSGNYEYHFYVIDLESLDIKYELNNEEYKQRSFHGVYDCESYYYAANDGKEFGIYNITTGATNVLWEKGLERESLSICYGAGGKMYYSLYNSETKTIKDFLYDEANDTTWDLTQKCEELGIFFYDVYRGMFIRHLYDESGEDIIGKSVVSEASILGVQ
ncbi:MAG: hypothetical protein E7261_00695 [Lachnospiraceae bacterium]|nr:hypothetical protein [Lachnospiraceae bacterium]